MTLSKTLALFTVVSLATRSAAHPEYRQKIPNALNVKGVDAIGHVDPEGGGARNKFGLAFAANELKWTVELCKADSDGDGQTNGQELGDPCCEWVETSNPNVLWTTGVSAPGDATSKSDPKLWAAVACGTSTSNATSSSSAAAGSTAGTVTEKPSTSTTVAPATTATATPATTTKAPNATTAPSATKSAAAVDGSVITLAVGVAATAIALFV